MTNVVIKPWFERPTPIPTDFIGTQKFFAKTVVLEKKEGVNLPYMAPGVQSPGYSSPAYFIFLRPNDKDLRVTVSKQVFDLLEIGNEIVVFYRVGRWTGAVEGKIAQ